MTVDLVMNMAPITNRRAAGAAASFLLLFGLCSCIDARLLLLEGSTNPDLSTGVNTSSGHQFAQFDDIPSLCSHFGLQPRRAQDPEPMVYDFFLVGYEPDMTEIRLRELDAVVHTFVLVESRMTYSGRVKPLSFPTVLQRLPAHVIDKTRYIVLDKLEGVDNWAREQQQRSALFGHGLRLPGVKPEPHDILLVSDADEIPKPVFLHALKQCFGAEYPLTMQSRLSYYSYGRALELGKEGSLWTLGPKAVLAGHQEQSQMTPLTLRRFNAPIHPNTSWHCSTCFSTVASVQEKMRSFSHAKEWDTHENRDPRTIVERVRTGNDVFGRLELWGPSPFLKLPFVDMPSYVAKHPARFGYLVDRDTPDAGFTDVDF